MLNRLILLAASALLAGSVLAQSAVRTPRLTFVGRATSPLSSADNAVMYYDTDNNTLYVSRDGGAFETVMSSVTGVTLDTTQTITGAKTFTNQVTVTRGIGETNDGIRINHSGTGNFLSGYTDGVTQRFEVDQQGNLWATSLGIGTSGAGGSFVSGGTGIVDLMASNPSGSSFAVFHAAQLEKFWSDDYEPWIYAIQSGGTGTHPLIQFLASNGTTKLFEVARSGAVTVGNTLTVDNNLFSKDQFYDDFMGGNYTDGYLTFDNVGANHSANEEVIGLNVDAVSKFKLDAEGDVTLQNLTINGTCTGCGGAAVPVADTTSIIEGSGDATKEVRFEVDGLTTGTVRVVTVPDFDLTIAPTASPTFTGTVTIPASVVTSAGTNLSASATAPAAANGASQAGKTASIAASNAVASLDTAGAAAGGAVTITSGNAARLTSGNANGGDINLVTGTGIGTGTAGQVVFPDGTAAAPGLALFTNRGAGIFRCGSNCVGISSGGAEVVRVLSSFGLYPSTANAFDLGTTTLPFRSVFVQTSTQGGGTKTLTESAATGFATVAIASGSHQGGTIQYSIEANDGTDFQTISGTIAFAAVNKAGTITPTFTTPDAGNETVAVSAGTLTNTFTLTQAANVLTFNASAVSSLTQTTLRIKYHVTLNGTNAVAGL